MFQLKYYSVVAISVILLLSNTTAFAAQPTASSGGAKATQAALDAETTSRLAGDQANQDAIAAEAVTRAAADKANQDAIAAESASRASGDQANQGAITTESITRAAADKASQDTMAAEIANRIAADNVLQTNITNISLTPGPQGETGAIGAQGLKGDTGAAGIQGTKGEIGAKGAQGVAGINGTNGAKGLKGAQGSKGVTGAAGIQGTKGEIGAKGDQGVAGINGTNGAKGLKGAQGSKGVAGAAGIQGAKGDTGTQGLIGSRGPRGYLGLKGNTGAQGLRGPQGVAGSDGDDASLPVGADPGDIMYWDGSTWVLTPALVAKIGCGKPRLTLINGVPTWSNSSQVCYKIGDTGPAGGIVFYIRDNGAHGLEVARKTLPPSAWGWGCNTTHMPGADRITIGAGAQNTTDILVGCAESNVAKKVSQYLAHGTYKGWFIPSQNELEKLYSKKNLVAGFANGPIWSSTQRATSYESVYVRDFGTGWKGGYTKNNSRPSLLPIRAF